MSFSYLHLCIQVFAGLRFYYISIISFFRDIIGGGASIWDFFKKSRRYIEIILITVQIQRKIANPIVFPNYFFSLIAA